NRMNVALDLGKNNIIGADNVETGDGSGQALTVNRSVHAQGSAYVGGNLTVRGDLRVERGGIRMNNLTVGPGYNTDGIAQNNYGNINVGGNFNTTNLDAGGSVYVSGDAHLSGADANIANTSQMRATALTGGA